MMKCPAEGLPLLLALALLAACRQANPPQPLESATLTVERFTVSAEIADTPPTMTRGLMFRDALPPDHGMLFVFERPRRASFWMRNTRIPLSVAYLDADGRILEIHDLFPHDETPVPSYSDQVAYALEMNRGWFARHGITPGMTVSGGPIPAPTAEP
ncbi:MAG: DUF192 domain-containing protein [Verrucomicrobiales bacterium]|jgi:uncharacterized membrane protein (UPF0127 family)|nr:DUF192 domain-containing protein [Verrucomicrobiales bacterium]